MKHNKYVLLSFLSIFTTIFLSGQQIHAAIGDYTSETNDLQKAILRHEKSTIDQIRTITWKNINTDTDGDGILNKDDKDIDGDGVANIYDIDIDGDGIANAYDKDIDGDGILNKDDKISM